MVYTTLSYQEYPYTSHHLFSHKTQLGSCLLPLKTKFTMKKFKTETVKILDNTGDNHNHNDSDCYIVLIRTQVDNIQ